MTTNTKSPADRIAADVMSRLYQRTSDEKLHGVLIAGADIDRNGVLTYTADIPGIADGVRLPGARSNGQAKSHVGQIGYLIADVGADGVGMAARFFPYVDQTLVPDPLRDDFSKQLRGWRCASQPRGFTAPAHITPGKGGAFVPDETVPVTIRVPPEFVRIAHEAGMSAERVLRYFVGDACGLRDTHDLPRADGLSKTSGTDEEDAAEAYLDRALGPFRENAAAFNAERERAAAADEEYQTHVDDMHELLEHYTDAGGNAPDLIAQVRTIVDAKTGRSS